MTDIDLKTLTPDTSLPTTGFLFGADSQATASPSVYSTQAVATTLLGSTTLTGATLTADAPVLNLAQTWSNVAVTFTGVKFNATDTTSAAASLLMDLGTGGGTFVSKFSVSKFGTVTASENTTANILALRNSTTSQAFRVYNTYTDASNYERGVFDFKTTANVLTIGTEKLGTGATRNIQFLVGGVLKADFGVTGSAWTFVGNIQTPNSIQVTFDISVGRNLSLGPNPYTGGSTVTIFSNTSGVLQLSSGTTASSGDFNRLTFGGATSSFPAIKRSTTSLQARLADDSAFTNIQGKLTTDTARTAGDPSTDGYLVIYDSTGTAYKVPCVAL